MKNVIITGGTGFIGSWLIQELLENGICVLALVRNKNRLLPEFFTNNLFSFIECDLLDLTFESLPALEYDCFYHLAWNGVEPERKNDFNVQISNILISKKMLELSSSLHCKKFITTGTVAEYVFSKDVINTEERQTPNDLYGAAKASTFYFLQVCARKLKQPFVWALIPSTFGERRTDNNIITYTISTLLKGEKPSFGNLEQVWDFLYVSEVVRALRLIGEQGKTNKIYGIGSGKYLSLKNYITSIRDLINPELKLGIGENPAMSNQTVSSCVNIEELTKDTGFVPKISFETGIKRTIDYMQKKLNVPMLSICIPTYNRTDILRDSLNSIYSQNIDETMFEVCISDDSSTFETENMIKKEFSQHTNLVYKRTVCESFMNLIEALKLGHGEFLKLCNDTSIFQPNSLNKLLAIINFARNDKPVIFFPCRNNIEDNSKVYYNDFDSFMNDVSYFSTWACGFGIWKDTFYSKLEKRIFIDKMFPHTSFLFDMSDSKGFLVYDYKYLEIITPPKKGGYNIPETFGKRYILMLNALFTKKEISFSTFCKIKKDVLKFIIDWFVNVKIEPTRYTYDFSHNMRYITEMFGKKEYIKFFFISRKFLAKKRIAYIKKKIKNLFFHK